MRLEKVDIDISPFWSFFSGGEFGFAHEVGARNMGRMGGKERRALGEPGHML